MTRVVDEGAVAASLLAQGAVIDRLSCILTAGALLGLMLVPVLAIRIPPIFPAVGVLVALTGICELYYAFRVRFDAALFTAGDADLALVALGLLPQSKAGRPIEVRIAGAKNLLLRQAVALALQVLVIIAGAALASQSERVPWAPPSAGTNASDIGPTRL